MARRQYVYRTEDALEIDDHEDYVIRRSRLFYDEILLLTYHRRVGWAFVLGCSTLVALAAFLGAAVWRSEGWKTGAAIFACVGLPGLILGVIRLIYRLDVVSVYGKRTWARMEFGFRKRRAREVYELVASLAREHQAPAAADTEV